MNITKLKKLCVWWQKELRLQDWDIELEVASSPTDLPSTCYAITSGSSKYKRSKILFNRPEWLDNEACLNDDLEVTLVHELLHLRFPSTIAEDERDGDEEGIERVAELLVKLKRNNNA